MLFPAARHSPDALTYIQAQGMDLMSAKLLRRKTHRLKLFHCLPTQETTAKRIASFGALDDKWLCSGVAAVEPAGPPPIIKGRFELIASEIRILRRRVRDRMPARYRAWEQAC